MRKSYLENRKRGIYLGLLFSGELKKYLSIETSRKKIWFACGVDGKAGGSDWTTQGTEADVMGAENE